MGGSFGWKEFQMKGFSLAALLLALIPSGQSLGHVTALQCEGGERLDHRFAEMCSFSLLRDTVDL